MSESTPTRRTIKKKKSQDEPLHRNHVDVQKLDTLLGNFIISSTGPIEPSPRIPKLIKEEAEEGAVGVTTFRAAIRPATTASHSGAANVVDMEAVDFSDTDNEMTDKDIKKVWQKAKREYDSFEETDDYIIPSNPVIQPSMTHLHALAL